MLFLLRKIRRKLMEKNKFTTYLLYAFGEIVLVVIGILLALQINVWNGERILQKQETMYLSRLIAENEKDLVTISNSLDEVKLSMSTIDNFCNALNDTSVGDSAVIQAAQAYLQHGSVVPQFNSSSSTFEDLSSTGNMRVIQDENLRNDIIQHYNDIVIMQERMRVNSEWAIAIDGPFYFEFEFMRLEPNTSHLFPERSANQLVKEMRSEKLKYINNAASGYWVDMDTQFLLEKLREKTTSLIDQMKREIESQN